jgi:hypothetical protein
VKRTKGRKPQSHSQNAERDLPEPIKTLVWIKDNLRTHPWYATLIICVIAIPLFERPELRSAYDWVSTGLLKIKSKFETPAPFDFSAGNILANSDTCLHEPGMPIVPAGARVCVRLTGRWLGSNLTGTPAWEGSIEPSDVGRPTLVESRRVSIEYPDEVLTPFAPYGGPKEFQEKFDYYICVRPPPHAAQDPVHPMTLEVKASDRYCPIPHPQR